MSPALKSKFKDRSQKSVKEQSKVSIMKPSSLHSNTGNSSTPTSYNPLLGSFRTLEISPPQSSGRFRAADEPDDQSGSSPGTTLDYDLLSNNDSSSGDSEDQKDKPSGESEDPREKSTSPPPSRVDAAVPGCDNDKRDKIRQKNERKHQRQKERRAQELHERCSALLVSRKLEALSGQLVAMGFPSDKTTAALILNEGKMEESVVWLLHDGEDDNKQLSFSLNSENNTNTTTTKIDISDELAGIAELEIKYKCSKQDVERAVVSCEGDLSKAENNLILQKQSVPSASSQKPDESIDSIGSNDKMAAVSQTTNNHQPPPPPPTATTTVQQLRQERRDPNYSKPAAPRNLLPEPTNKSLQQSAKSSEWSRAQMAALDKSWLTNSSAPSTSQPLSSPVPAAGVPTKADPWFGIPTGVDVKMRTGVTKEAFITQRPKQTLPPLGIVPSSTTGWYSGGGPSLDILTTANTPTLQHFYPQNNTPVEFSASAPWNSHTWNPASNHLPLATPSSLGLFAGWCSSGSSGSSSNDWNASGNASHPDYTAIDWSLDRTPLRPSSRIDTGSETWSTMFMGGNTMLPTRNRRRGGFLYGVEGDGEVVAAPAVQEWSNPFEGMDLFRVPRQYVTSPSL